MSTSNSEQDQPKIAVVIMAGGAGTRFWPLSTEARPKQFLQLFGDRTLLQLSYDRVTALVPDERILVLTNERFVSQVHDQLPDLPYDNVVGEPTRKDTAAAVTLAALLCERRLSDGDTVMAVVTADHLIQPVELFHRTLLSAARGARDSGDALYTFGIRPSYPATGYGYLQRGERVLDDEGIEHYRLLRFKEKPDLQTAKGYVDSGEYYWNSGMFVWTVEAILAQLRQHLPEHVMHLERAVKHDGSDQWERALAAGFEPLERISIDFGVMEKANNVRCVASSFGWSDVGGWLALEEFLGRDASGNTSRGELHVEQARNNLVFCEDQDEVVALVGVQGLVVIRAGDRTLVVHRDKTEQIKKLVQQLDESLR